MYITKSHFDVIFVFFFKIYVNLCDTAIKDIFFSVCITCRNEAIIVELKAFFVLNGTLSPFLGVPIIGFLTITKNDASSRL